MTAVLKTTSRKGTICFEMPLGIIIKSTLVSQTVIVVTAVEW